MTQSKSATTPKAKLSRKEIRERAAARQQFYSRLTWGAVVILALIVLGYAGWQLVRPRPGVGVPQMGRTHIEVGAPHEAYNTDPPTSGPHYAQPVSAGFYDEAPPDENLVHSLEHGYVIIWYNCTSLAEGNCQSLKTQIRGVLDRAGPVGLFSDIKKLIAVPRPKMDALLALTSWGRLLKLGAFDEAVILDFINNLRGQAPEGNVP